MPIIINRVNDIHEFFRIEPRKAYQTPLSTNGAVKTPDAYTIQSGWHVYTYLRCTQDLEKPERSTDAIRYTQIMQANAAATKTVVDHFPYFRLLEVQGMVNHLFATLDDSPASIAIIREAATMMTALIQAKVAPLADNDFLQFHQAADFGRSVLLRITSWERPSDSIISLGNCANRPAKQMAQSEAGIRRPLWLPTAYVPDGDGRKAWVACETLGADDYRIAAMNADFSKFDEYERKLSVRKVGTPRQAVILANMAQPLTAAGAPPATAEAPAVMEAFLCRADMNGFTAQVEEAFDAGPDAVFRLVQRFASLAGYADAFKKKADFKVIDLPWAGDCVNFIVLPLQTGDYSGSARHLPPRIAKFWHEVMDERANGDTWRGHLAGVDWVFCAGGGELFVADLMDGERQFRVVAGWPNGITQQGVNLDDTRGGWTIMHRENVAELSGSFQRLFQSQSRDYQYAPLEAILKAEQQAVHIAAQAAGASTAMIGSRPQRLAPSRPYATVDGKDARTSTLPPASYGSLQVDFAERVRVRFGFSEPLCSMVRGGQVLFGTHGRLTLAERAVVNLRIEIDADIRHQPAVYAVADWLSPYAEWQDQNLCNWHRYTNGKLCHGHPQDWYEQVERVLAEGRHWPAVHLTERVAAQLYKDVVQLLRYHWIAYELGLRKWAVEWMAHPHGGRLSA